MPSKIELAFTTPAIELRTVGNDTHIVGLAIPYNTWSKPVDGKFIERFLPNSFAETLKPNDEVFAYVEHDNTRVIAKRSNGTLVLSDRPDGMYVDVKLNDTTYSRDLAENVRSKTIEGMSFGFLPVTASWDRDTPYMKRTISSARLFEVTFTHNPVYPDTKLSLRSLYHVADVPNFPGETKPLQVATEYNGHLALLASGK